MRSGNVLLSLVIGTVKHGTGFSASVRERSVIAEILVPSLVAMGVPWGRRRMGEGTCEPQDPAQSGFS